MLYSSVYIKVFGNQWLLLWVLSFSAVHLLTSGLLHLPPLNHSENRWFFFLQGSTTTRTFQSVSTTCSTFLSYDIRLAFMSRNNIDFIKLDFSLKGYLRLFFTIPSRSWKSSDGHRCCSSPIPWQSAIRKIQPHEIQHKIQTLRG